MTINLYITSTQYYSGKSAVCVALMDRLLKDGYKVGFLKPFSSAARASDEGKVDEDVRFMKETFNLPESLDTLSPVVLTARQVKESLIHLSNVDYSDKVIEASQAVAEGRDVVVMEGCANYREGRIVNLPPGRTADLLDAKVITVVGYQNSLQVVDDILTARTRVEDRLVGVIINNVPQSRLDYVNNQVSAFLKEQEINLLAVLPHETVLSSISVGDIAETLQGDLLQGDTDELVENLMVAAMDVDQALTHFRRVTNKAVIVGGDRPDIQLVAMETSTKVLILTGNIRPNPMIQAKAEEQGVAIIISPYDTFTTVESVERFFGKTRFRQAEKVSRFEKMLDDAMDFDTLYKELGLK